MKALCVLKDIGKWLIAGCIYIPFLLVALLMTVKGYFTK